MTPEQRYAELVAVFVDRPGVTQADGTRGFGSSALKVGGRIFAMLTAGRLVVKLPRRRVDELTAAGQGERLDIGGGRAMREWLSVDPSAAAPWEALAGEALAFVGPE